MVDSARLRRNFERNIALQVRFMVGYLRNLLASVVLKDFYRVFQWQAVTEGIGARLLAYLAIITATVTIPAFAEEQPSDLWPSRILRIDRTQQTYERLPDAVRSSLRSDDGNVRLTINLGAKFPDSGSFVVKGVAYRLAGIVPVESGRICRHPDGTRWSCGLAGRVFLQNLILGRPITCRPQASVEANSMLVCFTDRGDVAAAVVGAGFATALSPDSDYHAAEVSARNKGNGIWSADTKRDEP